MKLIIDRKENDKFVCEDEECNQVIISCDQVEDKAVEGDIIILENGKFRVLKEETEKRRKEILDLQNSLWE